MFFCWMLHPDIMNQWLDGFGIFKGVVSFFAYTFSAITFFVAEFMGWRPSILAQLDVVSVNSKYLLKYLGSAMALKCAWDLWVKRKQWKPYMDSMIQNFETSGMDYVTRSEILKKPSQWAKVKRVELPVTHQSKSTKMTDLRDSMQGNICEFVYYHDDKSSSRCHLTFLKTGVVVGPGHAWKKSDLGLQGVMNFISYSKRNVCLKRSTTYFIEGKDLFISFVATNCSSKKDLTSFLPLDYPTPPTKVWAIADLDSYQWQCGYVTSVSLIDSKSIGDILMAVYNVPAKKGDCSLPVLGGSDKTAFILGFHVAKMPSGNLCGASVLTQTDWTEFEIWSPRNVLCLNTTELASERVVSGISRPINNPIHPNNVVNYIPSEIVDEIPVYGVSEKKFTMKSCLKEHPLASIIKEYFKTPDLHKPVFSNKVMREFLGVACENFSVMEESYLRMACEDLATDFNELEETLLNDIKRDSYYEKFFRKTPYTIDDIVKGVPDHPFRKGLNRQSSAGIPYNKKKDLLLIDGIDGPELVSEVTSAIHIEQRLWSGFNSGCVAKTSFKDEPVKLEKVEKPRLFQCMALDWHIMVLRHLAPLMDMCAVYPEKSGLAVGISTQGVAWHEFIRIFYGIEDNFIMDLDFKKFDWTMPIELRIGVSKVVSTYLSHLYGDNYSNFLEGMMFDKISPLVEVNGVVVQVNNAIL